MADILAGLRAIEAGQGVALAFCGKLLADLGASVLKIEPPKGDPARAVGPFPGDRQDLEASGLYLYLNTNKSSLALDLRRPQGHEIFQRLLPDTELVILGGQPADLEGRGLSPQTLSASQPRLVVTSLTPFGWSGPNRDYRAYELNLWHTGGMGFITREIKGREVEPGPPVLSAEHQAECIAGLTAAITTLGALFHQRLTGSGQWVDIAAVEAVAALPQAALAFPQVDRFVIGKGVGPIYGGPLLPTQDGYHALIALVEEHQWEAVINFMGNPAWAEGGWWRDRQRRAENMTFMQGNFATWLAAQSGRSIAAQAEAEKIPFAITNTVADVLEEQQLEHRQFWVQPEHPRAGKWRYPGFPARLSECAGPAARDGHAPLLGGHTRMTLARLGYDERQIASLEAAGVIAAQEAP